MDENIIIPELPLVLVESLLTNKISELTLTYNGDEFEIFVSNSCLQDYYKKFYLDLMPDFDEDESNFKVPLFIDYSTKKILSLAEVNNFLINDSIQNINQYSLFIDIGEGENEYNVFEINRDILEKIFSNNEELRLFFTTINLIISLDLISIILSNVKLKDKKTIPFIFNSNGDIEAIILYDDIDKCDEIKFLKLKNL